MPKLRVLQQANEAGDDPAKPSQNPLHWIFDPLPPSGAIHGGVPTSHIFTPDIDTLVREVIQNSLDQRVEGRRAHVRFTIETLDEQAQRDFLEALSWRELEGHVEGATKQGFATISQRLVDGLSAAKTGPLLLLIIEDSGTEGLTGDEDESGTNFNSLCRNTLDTSEDRPLRGGSYGLGKAVLWSFSSLSTVLFSSRLNDGQMSFRLFGRAELSYHSSSGRKWAGPGWFGAREKRRSRAVSVRDSQAEEAARALHLFRPAQAGTGTSILVAGLFEPQRESQRSSSEIASAVIDSTSRWFWPSMLPGSETLEVEVEVRENGGTILKQDVPLSEEVKPFVLAATTRSARDTVTEPGGVAACDLELALPARRTGDGSIAWPSQTSHMTLRVRHCEPEDGFGMGTVALVRGAGMVVRYMPFAGARAGGPFHGVMLAGTAHGQDESDLEAERFLRAAEPPSHRDWDASTERVRAEYRRGGGQASLRRLWQALESSVRLILDPPAVVGSPEGPRLLSRMFTLGRTSPPREAGLSIDALDAVLEDSRWRFSGTIQRRGGSRRPWSFVAMARLVAESGLGEAVPIASLEAPLAEVSRGSTDWLVRMPASTNRVEIVGETTALNAQFDQSVQARSRLRIEVQPVERA